MDPEAAYRVVCDGVNAILNDVETDIVALAEAFEALDGWIKSGGFMPRAWSDPSRSIAELQEKYGSVG